MNTPSKIASIALLVLGLGVITSNAQTDVTLKLKHRSSFSNAPARNPFWPIGWVKGENAQGSEQEAEVPITADSFVVTSISISSTPQAIINGKIYAEGDVINALYGGQKVKIQVMVINDGDVILQYLGKKYTVPLKRPELSSHKAETSEDTLPKKDDVLILH